MGDLGRFECQDALGLVDLAVLEGLQTPDLVERQEGEDLEETADVPVIAIDPVLVEIERRRLVRRKR